MSATEGNTAVNRDGSDAGDEQDVGLESLKQATIMMVDDEPIIIETLENLLEDAGYKNFVTTNNPMEAIELIQTNKPDIVLLDVMMPEVTGLDILESMGMDEDMQYIPSIIITAATDSETKLRALELGATDVLNKPVDASELALRVRNTLATKANQDRLMKFDALTGLPNRRFFMLQFANALSRTRESSSSLALLYMDLDNFKKINDTLGNTTADGLLKGVAKRLESWLRDSNIASISGVDAEDMALSRIGGDEFVLILHNVGQVDNALKIAGEVTSALAEPYRVSGREVYVTASIGVAVLAPGAGEEPGGTADGEIMGALLSQADIAMAEAKRRGRNLVQQYTPELNASARERKGFETKLRNALESRELELLFQPKASVWTNQITGAEAHLRWRSPELGEIPPEQFIPVAEEANLIKPISEWMIYEACTLAARWQAAATDPVRITVGISSRQFDLTRLMLAIRTALNNADVPGERLGVEFTESIFVDNPEENLAALKGIRDLGVGVAIGRFGTGQSSLAYLRSFPVDQIKIDPSFLTGVPSDADNAAIVASFISMTHGLGLTVVADGVESGAQLDFLKDRGCDEYQGQLLGEPMAASEFLSKATGGE